MGRTPQMMQAPAGESEPEKLKAVFVYGTLKRGYGNHRLLEDAVFAGEAVTAPKYRMFDAGAFPYMVVDEDSGIPIHGEVYVITPEILERLDSLEGVAYGHYRRIKVDIDTLDGPPEEVGLDIEGYVVAQRGYERVLGYPECTEGVWPRNARSIGMSGGN